MVMGYSSMQISISLFLCDISVYYQSNIKLL